MNAIFKRRSIRKYTDQVIPEEHIEQLLRAAMAAPSAWNQQPWHFVVIDHKKILNEIPKFHPYSKMLTEASHAIVVCCDVNTERYNEFWVQDCAAATQNILLMATELGIGSVWLGLYPNQERVQKLKELLGLPDNIIPFCIISLGYPAESKGPANRFDAGRIHRNKW
ncbi:MAG: nitroreductase family protein [Caldicoprobacterales bacterium]|jgi:nitroreductase|nr:nitroreductase family protein [Clostridiales bacterium]